MKFILVIPENIIVGHFELSETTNYWSFRYAESFKRSKHRTLEDFPSLNVVYDNTTCLKWLTDKILPSVETTQGLSLSEGLIMKSGHKDNYFDLHMIH